MTEPLQFHSSLSCIGEGNGNPLQCSCLENPRDRGAWWAAVYGVAQSQTQLKRLSSNSKLLQPYRYVSTYFILCPILTFCSNFPQTECLITIEIYSFSSGLQKLIERQQGHVVSKVSREGCCCLVAKLCPTLLPSPWTVAHQAPLSMGFPRQEYWSGLPFPFPGDLPDPGFKPASLVLAGRFFSTEPPGTPLVGGHFLAFSNFWQLLVSLGLWQHNSYLCLYLHMAFPHSLFLGVFFFFSFVVQLISNVITTLVSGIKQ